MLGKLNADVGETHELATRALLRLEGLERRIEMKSEMAGRRGARKGARWQALAVSLLVSTMGMLGNYFAARAHTTEAHSAAGLHR